MNIPDEAVEAAFAHLGPDETGFRYVNKARIRAIIEVAAPYLVADALEDAANAMSGAVVPVGYLLSCAKALRSGKP